MIMNIIKFSISLLLLNSTLFACRYTVREIGFADYGADAYHFYLFKDDRISDKDAVAFKKISYAAFLDANVSAQVVDVHGNDSLSISILQFYKKDSNGNLPNAVLVSPEKKAKPFTFSNQKEGFKESLWSALEEIVTSQARDELLQKIVKAYAVVYLIEGTDPSKTMQAHQKAEAAINKIKLIMSDLPKPVDHPPELIDVKKDEIENEQVLLWSLDWQVADKSEPAVAVIYGRGRRMGPLLKGEQITENLIQNMLRFVGADCECGLDRTWMLGTMVPLRWDSQRKTEIVRQFGFDADNPMVVSEMSQILSIAPERLKKSASSGNLYGYSEGVLTVSDSASSTNEDVVPAEHAGFNIKGALLLIIVIFVVILISGGIIVIRAQRRHS